MASLVIRKRADGRTTIDSDVPAEHVFPASFLERELGDVVEVTVRLKTSDGDVEYRLEGFDPLDEANPDAGVNFGAWRCVREE